MLLFHFRDKEPETKILKELVLDPGIESNADKFYPKTHGLATRKRSNFLCA